jgi:hypothetical protein
MARGEVVFGVAVGIWSMPEDVLCCGLGWDEGFDGVGHDVRHVNANVDRSSFTPDLR